MKNLKAGIGGALLTLVAVCGFVAASNATAQAQYRQYPNDRDDQYHRDHDRNDVRRDRERERTRRDRTRDKRNNRNARNGGYGNNGRNNNNAYQTIQNQGYQNGLSTGASDADRGQSYNPQRSHYYRDATKNNNDRQYAQVYRDGFLQGYEAGYRQYSDSRNGRDRRNNSGSGIGSILGGIFGQP